MSGYKAAADWVLIQQLPLPHLIHWRLFKAQRETIKNCGVIFKKNIDGYEAHGLGGQIQSVHKC